MAAADAGRPVQPAPAVGRGPRRPRGRPGTAAARSSVCCTPTVSRCTGCTAAGRRRRSRSQAGRRRPPQAHIALWRVLLGMDLIETVTVGTHPDDVLPVSADRSAAGADRRASRTRCGCGCSTYPRCWRRAATRPICLWCWIFRTTCSVVAADSRSRCATGRARCVPTDAAADVHTDLSVLGSLYMGGHRASAFATANRLRCNDSGLVARAGRGVRRRRPSLSSATASQPRALDEAIAFELRRGRCRRAAASAGSSSGRPTRPRPGRRCRGPWRSSPRGPRR